MEKEEADRKERESLNAKQEEERSNSQKIPKTYTNNIGMKFTHIPKGEFMMGSEECDDSEKPLHRVKIIKPFYLGTYPVTQEEWKSVMGNNPSTFKGDNLRTNIDFLQRLSGSMLLVQEQQCDIPSVMMNQN